ncbi:MAG: squalene/phytoene synthase family protein [Pseudomonadota bacterium]
MTEAIEPLYPLPVKDGIDPQAEADAITKASGTSFAAGMKILPKERRDGMHAVYAFCRLVDDIADGPWDAAEKHKALDAWRDEIDALYEGAPRSTVGHALLPHVKAFDLPKDEFLEMINGMAMDADGPIVAPSREELALYTRRVAGSVGVLSIRIFGAYIGPVSDEFALCLGDALQLTNILRDVEEDAEIDRLYLPKELLAAHGIAAPTPAIVANSDKLHEIRADLGKEAKACYDEARRLAVHHRRKDLRPALMMMGAYEGYWERMAALRWRLSGDMELLSKWQKLFRGLRYGFFGPGAPRVEPA